LEGLEVEYAITYVRCVVGQFEPVANMKIIKDSINRSSLEGTIKVEPQEEEDMYFLYQILTAGDEVESLTVRNVRIGGKGGWRRWVWCSF
jgi:hypothetical protein